jgi:hypothetical protein
MISGSYTFAARLWLEFRNGSGRLTTAKCFDTRGTVRCLATTALVIGYDPEKACSYMVLHPIYDKNVVYSAAWLAICKYNRCPEFTGP